MDKRPFFVHYPAIPLLVCFIIGIIVGHTYCLSINYNWLIGLTTLFLCFGLIFRRHYQIQTVSILITSFIVGIFTIVLHERQYLIQLPVPQEVCKAIVIDEPIDNGKAYRADLSIVSGSLKGRKVRAYFQKDSMNRANEALQVGAGLILYTSFTSPRNHGKTNFDYITYLKTRGIVAQTYVDKESWMSSKVSLSTFSRLDKVRLYFLCLRHRLLSKYRDLGMAGQGLAVAQAVTLGDKSCITSSMRDLYSQTGTSHLLALSGMHLGIVFSFLVLGTNRRRLGMVRSLLSILAIWAYVFLVGTPISVVRAAIMFTIYIIISLSNRENLSINSLAFTAFIMLYINPFMLYDIGFQLSFLAVTSILLLYRPITSLCPFMFKCLPVISYFFQLSFLSIAAQIGTLPLVVYYFGCISLYFLPANIVVVPIILIVLYTSIILLAFSFIHPLAIMASSVVMTLIYAAHSFLSTVSSWPYATIDNIYISIHQVILAYVIIICAYWLCIIQVRAYLRQKM